MSYSKITIPFSNPEHAEIISAWLADHEYLGVEEQENMIITYSKEGIDQHQDLKTLLQNFSMDATFSSMEDQNWNAVWESNFEPVVIPGKIIVRAFFHEEQAGFDHEIKITPKMSFGTGHHATTKMMMLAMLDIPFQNKSVLDFGTGTGILAILAEQLGATRIDAIDNDQWSVENALENIATNNSKHIQVMLGENVESVISADIILANINKHILMEHVESLSNKLNMNGILIISGLLNIDYEDITTHFTPYFGNPITQLNEGEWIALVFHK
jgi:ribosomal protein L11 methyltransferase